MPRPNRSEERRAELLPSLARSFAAAGYRRATTAELAGACGVQETILYRLWPSKKEMFLDAIEHVFENTARTWGALLEEPEGDHSGAERLLEYEAFHLGELGLYRILFAGLSETDDPEVRTALRRTFERFQAEIAGRIREHRGAGGGDDGVVGVGQAAWALVGLGMLANLGLDLELFSAEERRALIEDVGRRLLGEAFE